MQLSFSRGFSHGFLDGTNHKVLVRGDYAKKRGILLGDVESIAAGGRPADRPLRRSSRATASSSTATNRPAAPNRADASMR